MVLSVMLTVLVGLTYTTAYEYEIYVTGFEKRAHFVQNAEFQTVKKLQKPLASDLVCKQIRPSTKQIQH